MTRKEINYLKRALTKLNDDLAAFAKETDELDGPTLYEDAYTSYRVRNIKLNDSGTFLEYDYDFIDGRGYRLETENIIDGDEVRDWIKWWRACLRRAKRYWSMDTEVLDRIQDPEDELEDNED